MCFGGLNGLGVFEVSALVACIVFRDLWFCFIFIFIFVWPE